MRIRHFLENLLINYKLFIGLFLLLIVSCKKQEILNVDATGELTGANLYFPLSIGSYWVYQTFDQNDTGFVSFGNLDSIFIEKDTIINNNSYYKFNTIPPQNTPQFRRDSLGYIVDEVGRIFFSVSNFTDTLFRITDSTSNVPIISFKMEDKDTTINVQAGSFKCFDYKGFYYSKPPVSDLFGSPRYTYDFYAPNVGLLKKVYFFSASPYIVEIRLVRFHIHL